VVSELTLVVSRHIRAEVCGHEHGRVRGTDVAQGPLALDARTGHMGPLALDVWDVAKKEIMLLCPVWVSWFDVSTRTSSPLGWVIVTDQPMGRLGPDRIRDTIAKNYYTVWGTVASAQYSQFSSIPETEPETDQLK